MACKYCHSELQKNQNYCPNCGEQTHFTRLTLKTVISRFFSEFINVDNKLLKTFRHLTLKPDQVIENYIQGGRKKYMNVVSYLAISLSLLGFQLLVLKKLYPSTFSFTEEQLAESQIYDPKAIELTNKFMEVFFDYFGLINLVFIPVLAVLSYITFLYAKRHNYAEHIVSNTYISAHYTVLMFLLSIPLLAIGMNVENAFVIISILSYIFIGYCYKRLYNTSFLGSVWRTIVIMLAYTTVVMVVMFAIGIIIGLILGQLNK